MPDQSVEMLDINSLQYMESEFGVFVSDAGRDQDKLEQAKALGQSMVQNGVPASAVLDMFDTENFAGLKDKIQKAEKAQQELQAAQQKAQQEQAQQQAEMQQKQMEMDALEKEKDREVEIKKAMIAAESRDQSDRLQIDLEKMARDFEIKEQEIRLKERALDKEGDTEPNGV